MDTKHLTYFKVENFKRFDSLEVKDIGQFNLIVGDNNVGKTSLLEALLFDDENYDKFIESFLYAIECREIEFDNLQVSFIDFSFKDKLKAINYFYSFFNDGGINSLSLIRRNRNELSPDEIKKIIVPLQLNNSPHLIQFSTINSNELRIIKIKSKEYFNYYPLITFRSPVADDLIEFFSEVSISNKKLEGIKNELKYFIPDLISIELNNAIVPGKMLLAIRQSNSDYVHPLAEFGDGTIKLLSYLLELDFCENKRLMIDEIDAGIHYSRMKEFIKKILLNANNKNVQIFATTHSKECIEYYKQALEELGLQSDGRVIRIADTKSGIKAYTLNYEQIENSLYAESEIR